MIDLSGHVWGPLETVGVIALALIVTAAIALFISKLMRRRQPRPQQQGPLREVAAIRAIFTRMGPSVTARDIESGLIALESVGGARGAAPVATEQHQHQHQNRSHDKQQHRAPTVAAESTGAQNC